MFIWPTMPAPLRIQASVNVARRVLDRMGVEIGKPDDPHARRARQLADHMRCWHSASMSIQITIRDVSEDVRDKLAARAALQGKSMQEYLRAELERMAARPSIDSWLQQVRKRKRAAQTRVSASQILRDRDADRR
jgi:antitoxin FitA